MAPLRADEAATRASVADARVAAAKLRLRQLARDAERPPPLVTASASLIRAHPWRGIAIALAAGIVLGLAPRRTLTRVAPLVAPLFGMLPFGTATTEPSTVAGGQSPTPWGER